MIFDELSSPQILVNIFERISTSSFTSRDGRMYTPMNVRLFSSPLNTTLMCSRFHKRDVPDSDFFHPLYSIPLDKVSGSVSFRDREKGKEVIRLVEEGLLKELVVEEFSRLGRNTGDVISTLEYLDSMGVNVRVRNVGLESRPGGKKNPIWKMISSVMSSLYEMEKENILERTRSGRVMAIQRGVKMGRPRGTQENVKRFLNKPKNVEIQKLLKRGLLYSEIQKVVECSPKTISKVKKLMKEVG
jgi:DNA invertase Pin-like site-specific DNA recombinase